MATEKELLRELAETLRRASEIASQLGLADDVIPEVPEETSATNIGVGEEQTEFKQITKKDLEKAVTKLFIDLGIPAHIKGYKYLRTAILMAVEEPEVLELVTKKLYPNVARVYNTTASRVERAIRHAIETACEKGNYQRINEIFGYTLDMDSGKPVNSAFIAMIADKLRMEMME